MSESIEHPEYPGYQIRIRRVDAPWNPLEDGDCEPPLLAYHDHLQGYEAGKKTRNVLTVTGLLSCISVWKFGRLPFREALVEAMGFGWIDFFGYLPKPPRGPDQWRDAFLEAWRDHGSPPETWGEAEWYFRLLEFLCREARIACLRETTTGYCQGHAAQVPTTRSIMRHHPARTGLLRSPATAASGAPPHRRHRCRHLAWHPARRAAVA